MTRQREPGSWGWWSDRVSQDSAMFDILCLWGDLPDEHQDGPIHSRKMVEAFERWIADARSAGLIEDDAEAARKATVALSRALDEARALERRNQDLLSQLRRARRS